MKIITQLSRTAVSVLITAALSHSAFAESKYPEKIVNFIVPFSAGSATDQLARVVGKSITDQTKQAVVVENKPGASGMIAAQTVAKASADGYTVLITTNTTHAANEHLYNKLGYDPVKDFSPVTGLSKGGQVMVVRAEAPYKSVTDLIAKAKKEPGKVSFGSGSASSRVAGELFQQMTQTTLLHVPYKGNPNAITDLLGGQIDFMITDTATGLPHLKAGKLRALGASTLKRLPVMPTLATLDELGVKGYDMSYWFAAYVPANTPAPVVAKLRELIVAGLQAPGAKSFFEATGAEPWTSTPEELAKFQVSESAKWGKIIRAAGIEKE